jgi:hypothetical protein
VCVIRWDTLCWCCHFWSWQQGYARTTSFSGALCWWWSVPVDASVLAAGPGWETHILRNCAYIREHVGRQHGKDPLVEVSSTIHIILKWIEKLYSVFVWFLWVFVWFCGHGLPLVGFKNGTFLHGWVVSVEPLIWRTRILYQGLLPSGCALPGFSLRPVWLEWPC